MKFKKGHVALFKVIYEYFCNSLCDSITAKTQDCVKDTGYCICVVLSEDGDWATCTSPQEVTNEQIEQVSKYLDGICKKMQKYSKITLIDDIEAFV